MVNMMFVHRSDRWLNSELKGTSRSTPVILSLLDDELTRAAQWRSVIFISARGNPLGEIAPEFLTFAGMVFWSDGSIDEQCICVTEAFVQLPQY